MGLLKRCLPKRIGDVQVRCAFQRRMKCTWMSGAHLFWPGLEEGAGLIRKGSGDAAAEQHSLGHRPNHPVGPQLAVEGDRLRARVGEDAIDVVLQIAVRTPGRPWTTGMPCRRSSSPGPIPDSIMSCGVLTVPAAEDDLALRRGWSGRRRRRRSRLPSRVPPLRPRAARDSRVTITRLRRFRIGSRKAVEPEQRLPRLMVKSYRPNPSCSAPLKSSLTGWPGLAARFDERVEERVGAARATDRELTSASVVSAVPLDMPFRPTKGPAEPRRRTSQQGPSAPNGRSRGDCPRT